MELTWPGKQIDLVLHFFSLMKRNEAKKNQKILMLPPASPVNTHIKFFIYMVSQGILLPQARQDFQANALGI